jgi:hypothetical protein
VSLAAPYPGTELYRQAVENGWLATGAGPGAVRADGWQDAVLSYPGLPREVMFEAVDRFYRSYFLRPRPILRILETMLQDGGVFVRRCREGWEFFKTLRERKHGANTVRRGACLRARHLRTRQPEGRRHPIVTVVTQL